MSRFNTLLFLVIIFTLTLINLGTPVKPTVSEVEKRTLAALPAFSTEALFSGSYFRDFESHFSDTFAFRDAMAQAGAEARELRGIKVGDQANIFVNHNAGIGGHEKTAGDAEPENPNGQLMGTVLVLRDRAMEINKFNPQTTAAYARAINQLQARLGKTRVYSLLAPTQIEFAAEEYRQLSDSQQQVIQYVDKRLLPAVVRVNAYAALRRHADEYIYFRTDHHWTALGAYYAYAEFIEAAGADPIPLTSYQRGETADFKGSFYNLTLDKALARQPDTLVYYLPLVDSTFTVYRPEGTQEMSVLAMENLHTEYQYSVFLGGDHPLGRIATQVNNGKKIVVVKDSYGNAFIPFLLPHYQEIFIIDPRHYQGDLSKLVQDNDIQELLVLDYAVAPRFEAYVQSMQQLAERAGQL